MASGSLSRRPGAARHRRHARWVLALAALPLAMVLALSAWVSWMAFGPRPCTHVTAESLEAWGAPLQAALQAYHRRHGKYPGRLETLDTRVRRYSCGRVLCWSIPLAYSSIGEGITCELRLGTKDVHGFAAYWKPHLAEWTIERIS